MFYLGLSNLLAVLFYKDYNYSKVFFFLTIERNKVLAPLTTLGGNFQEENKK